jgi:hypothetical protein
LNICKYKRYLLLTEKLQPDGLALAFQELSQSHQYGQALHSTSRHQLIIVLHSKVPNQQNDHCHRFQTITPNQQCLIVAGVWCAITYLCFSDKIVDACNLFCFPDDFSHLNRHWLPVNGYFELIIILKTKRRRDQGTGNWPRQHFSVLLGTLTY